MSSFVHISQEDPETGRGGVAKFARHLREAIPELEFLSHNFQHGQPWRDIAIANQVVLENDPANTVVIADGYYGLGLAGKVKRLITVCHSTYAGWLRDNLMNPFPNFDPTWLVEAAKAQGEAYMQSDEIVAVSKSAQDELWSFYNLEARMIRNGIDLDLYQPSPLPVKGSLVEVAGVDFNKGADIISELRHKAKLEIHSLGYGDPERKRWGNYETVVMPSRHEGGPYAQLEAMAVNMKIVAYRSGYFKVDVPVEKYIWSTYDMYWGTFARLIEEAQSSDDKSPRDWVKDNASIQLFRLNWRNLLGVQDVEN